LVPRGEGCYRVALNGAVRKAAGAVDAGDEVLMTIRQGAPHRIPPVPADLAAALAGRPGGRLAFESWPPGRRRQILLWLDGVKSAEARARRIVRIVERLGL
jgi:uncharacterized protein YdeI (YjbR/CyaY-like superfamily)